MDKVFERAGCMLAALALSTLALAGPAGAQGEVTVGGVVEVIGGTTDHDNGVDGLSRGLFSRINVGYSNTLENGLVVSGNISYQVNQRGAGNSVEIAPSDLGLTADSGGNVMVDDAMMSMDNMGMDMAMTDIGVDNTTNYAPDILSLSVGGGFGTVSVGAHAPASCAMLPRPIALVPGGVNATWYTLFSGISSINGTFSEANYCGTSESISYATPTMGGLSAMITYAPNMGANQGTTLRNAVADGAAEDYMSVAGKYSTDMGGMSLNVGAAFQTAADDAVDSQSVAGTIGFGGATLGAAWFDNGDISGQSIGAKYTIGSISPGITYSSQERDSDGTEETALVLGASYAVGGGLSVFAEYMGFEQDDDEETILMSGIFVAF